jgi:ABC-2 type transport system permease protein
MYHPTVARLTYRGLLGRRRAAILFVLPVLLIAISAAVRLFNGADDQVAADLLGGFALATMVPLIGVIAGTGAIGPEIDDGSIVYLLAKPVKRPTIIFTKLIVAVGVTMVFSAVPTLIAGLVLNGNGQQIAVAYTVAALVASIAYSALFLLFGTVSRHAVVFGLVYVLVWEHHLRGADAERPAVGPRGRRQGDPGRGARLLRRVAAGRGGAAGRGDRRRHLVRRVEAADPDTGGGGVGARAGRPRGDGPHSGRGRAGLLWGPGATRAARTTHTHTLGSKPCQTASTSSCSEQAPAVTSPRSARPSWASVSRWSRRSTGAASA